MTDIIRVKDKDGLIHHTARDSYFVNNNDVVEIDEHGKPTEVPDAAEHDAPADDDNAGATDDQPGKRERDPRTSDR